MVSVAVMGQLGSQVVALLAWQVVAPLAGAETQTLLMRLTPQNRAIVLMALLGLVLLGFALVALAILGGRRVLREARRSPGPTPRYEDAWARKPMIDRVSDVPRDGHH